MYFGKLNNKNIMIDLVLIDDSITLDSKGNPSEAVGVAWLKANLEDANWIEIDPERRRGSIGYKYDQDLDLFIPPQPFPSWILNTADLIWEPPIPKPDSNDEYVWSEDTIEWINVTALRG